MAAFVEVDRRAEQFGAAVTIADLAVNSFPDHQFASASIYEVWEALERDWRFELDRTGSTMEYATGVSARFRDGSVLHIAAWADCCNGSGCRHCRG
jgi:hypothetical protein